MVESLVGSRVWMLGWCSFILCRMLVLSFGVFAPLVSHLSWLVWNEKGSYVHAPCLASLHPPILPLSWKDATRGTSIPMSLSHPTMEKKLPLGTMGGSSRPS